MANTQWLRCRAGSLPTTAAGYYFISAGDHAADETTHARAAVLWPASGRFKTIKVRLDAAPGVGKSWRFQINIGGSASTQVDVTISGTDIEGEASGEALVTDGNTASIICTPSGTPTETSATIWTEWEPTTEGEFVYTNGTGVNLVSSSPLFWAINGISSGQLSGRGTFGADSRSILPFAGTLVRWRVKMATAPGGANSRDFYVTKNGSDEANINVSGAATTGAATGLSVAFSALDTIGFHMVNNGGANTREMNIALCFVPDTDGDFLIGGAHDNQNYSNTLEKYYNPFKRDVTDWQDTDADKEYIVPDGLTLLSMAWEVTTAPGGTDRNDLTVHVGGSDSGMAISMAGTATEAASTGGPVPLSAGDLVSVHNTPIDTPVSPGVMNWQMRFGIVADLGGSYAFID